MIRDITIKDEDRHGVDIEFQLQVRFRCREEIGGPRDTCCEVFGVVLEGCKLWLAECGMEVTLDSEHIGSWQREIERRYAKEIEQQCIDLWWEERWAA